APGIFEDLVLGSLSLTLDPLSFVFRPSSFVLRLPSFVFRPSSVIRPPSSVSLMSRSSWSRLVIIILAGNALGLAAWEAALALIPLLWAGTNASTGLPTRV